MNGVHTLRVHFGNAGEKVRPNDDNSPVLGVNALELPNRARCPVSFGYGSQAPTMAIVNEIRCEDGLYIAMVDVLGNVTYDFMADVETGKFLRDGFYVSYELATPIVIVEGRVERAVLAQINITPIAANPASPLIQEITMEKHEHTWIRRSTHTHVTGGPTCRHFKCECGASKHDTNEENA